MKTNGIFDRPSQWLNFGYMCVTIVLFFMFPPLGVIVGFALAWKMIVLHFNTWSYTPDSIIERKGVFSVSTEEIQYFRIKDVELYEPFLYRLVGLCKITLITSDKSRPVITIDGVKDGFNKRNMFKKMSLSHRRKEGVREIDFV
jgi:uncharacterized membrane protein YdbT with pleckstrin-like domain